MMSIQRYQLKNRKLDKMSFHLLYISTSRYEGDWHSTPHAHHCTELFYVSSGKGSFLVNDDVFDVKADDLIIVNPNVPHTEMSRDESPLEYIVLGIEGLQFTSFTNHMEYEDYSVHNYYEFKHEILFYLKTLVQEMAQQDDDYEAVCQNLLEVLIINMVRRTKANLIVAPSQKITKECQFCGAVYQQSLSGGYHAGAVKCKKTYMNENFYLVHAFKQYKGVSPINYLIRLRVQQAKELLETTNYSIAQISDSCGFSSQSYFSQVFKKACGMTPNAYRKSSDRGKVVANDIT